MNARDKAVSLLESGVLSSEALLTECLQYMSSDDIADVLDTLGLGDDDE